MSPRCFRFCLSRCVRRVLGVSLDYRQRHQLEAIARNELDAKKVGYGAMLLEAMVAVVSLSCVMILSKEAVADCGGKPNFIYALGLGRFMEVFGIPASFGVLFGLMAFTTFVYDTLDVCTRLGRYILQELTGLQGNLGRYVSHRDHGISCRSSS
jgi:carbon starvation protein CstA